MAPTVFSPIADSIIEAIEGLTITPAVKAVKWARRELPSLPCAVVDLPTFGGTDVDEAESQLGTDDWTNEYLVSFYFAIGDLTATQELAAETLELFIMACRSDAMVGGLVLDAKVVSAEPVFITDEAVPMIQYKTTVKVLALVP